MRIVDAVLCLALCTPAVAVAADEARSPAAPPAGDCPEQGGAYLKQCLEANWDRYRCTDLTGACLATCKSTGTAPAYRPPASAAATPAPAGGQVQETLIR